MDVDDADAEDLRELIEEELRQRRFANVIRLEHGPDPDPWVLQFLLKELNLEADDVYEIRHEIDFSGIEAITRLPLPELKYPAWSPVVPAVLHEEESMFGIIRAGDFLVHHPYHSFSATVERFVQEAAEDPRVLSIKMTVTSIVRPESKMFSPT